MSCLRKSIEKNEYSTKERDEFDINQDTEIEFNEDYRSPGWERFKKKK